MSNQLNERVETLEEVTERLTEHSENHSNRILKMEGNIDKYPKVFFPDYAPQFQLISDQLNTVIKNQSNSQLDPHFDRLDKKLDKAIRNSPPSKERRHLIIYFSLVAVAAIFCGFAIGYRFEVSTLADLLSQKVAPPIVKTTESMKQQITIKPRNNHKRNHSDHSYTKQ